ncbi:hypothetical protein CCP2SC5_2110002 [Azospirillaceae bacterium]
MSTLRLQQRCHMINVPFLTIQTRKIQVGNGAISSQIDTAYDQDWWKIDLTRSSPNTSYRIDLQGSPSGRGTLSDTYLRGVYDSHGTLISNTSDDDSGVGLESMVQFTLRNPGIYYIAAGAYGGNTGSYSLTVTSDNRAPTVTGVDLSSLYGFEESYDLSTVQVPDEEDSGLQQRSVYRPGRRRRITFSGDFVGCQPPSYSAPDD